MQVNISSTVWWLIGATKLILSGWDPQRDTCFKCNLSINNTINPDLTLKTETNQINIFFGLS